MCFNKEVSLLTFLLGFMTSIKFFMKKTNKDYTIGTILLGISLMQLLEYFVFLNHSKNGTNLMLSFLIHVLIFMQVIALVSMVLGFEIVPKDSELYNTIIAFTCMFVVAYVVSTFVTDWKNAYVLKLNNCRLTWGAYLNTKWYMNYVLGLFYVLLMFLLFYGLLGVNGLALIVSTFLFSLIFSKISKRAVLAFSRMALICSFR